jgi:hypothetical protein
MQRAVLAVVVLGAVELVPRFAPALAQAQRHPASTDAELMQRLHELTRAKGVYALALGPDFCRRLGSRPYGNCEAFKADFAEGGAVKAEFFSLNDKRKNALHLFITSHLHPDYVDDYRVGLDGKLERAVRRRGEASSHLAVVDAMPGFERVMKFLHEKQDQLAGLPDATVIDDRSCAQGQVRRVPNDPTLAVCVDRARLKSR